MKIAVDSAIKYITVLVREDTDLLILLCYYASSDANAVYPEQRRNMITARVWDIMDITLKLGNELCDNLLFIHAFHGCDTTSSVFGINKVLALMKYLKDCNFRKYDSVFT